ncbi:MAG TPA: HAD family hydrolase, partial [Pirellulales bacterium]|nr:HAD family hydrolase [Pirellulales bacterium]
AIFLDKDGTLIDDVPYNVNPDQMRLAPKAGIALRRLARDYRLFVVSNQAGVAHGFFGEDALPAVEQRLRQLLAGEGIALDGFYYCPHHPSGADRRYRCRCACRKPQPGMLLQAAREHLLDLGQSWMIGDILDDIEAGRRAGCRTVLIDNGGETEWQISDLRQPEFVVADLGLAADRILASQPPPNNIPVIDPIGQQASLETGGNDHARRPMGRRPETAVRPAR